MQWSGLFPNGRLYRGNPTAAEGKQQIFESFAGIRHHRGSGDKIQNSREV